VSGKFSTAIDKSITISSIYNSLPNIAGIHFSISEWVKPTGDNNVTFWGLNQNHSRYPYIRYSSGVTRFCQSDTSCESSSAIVPVNTWSLVTLTYDGSLYRIYVNGELSATLSRIIDLGNLFSDYNFVINDIYHPQTIDDVRIYNRVLSADEVSQLYNGALAYHAPTTSPQNQSLLASISAALNNLIAQVQKYLGR
jgi:hypothetical protein